MTNATPGVVQRRTRRDWAVDAALFLLAATFGLVSIAARLESTVHEPEWLLGLDQGVGALGCAAVWLRRRWPTGLALVLVLASAFSESVSGAMLVALFTVAVHGRPARTWAIFALSLGTATCFVALRPDPGHSPALLVWMLGSAVQSAAVGWGLFVRHRRQLIATLREQALRAGAEAELRGEQAQQRARDELAREIHDVLGHRLSLLSVHAGALEYRLGAPPEDLARAAAVIRESAHQALQDLRDVVGVLRVPSGEERTPALPAAVSPARPQPTLADLPRQVAAQVGAGKSNADIAATLYLSVPTVKTHISSILTKLELNNRVQVALLAHDAGLGS